MIPNELLDTIVAIARDAGREILDVYSRDFSVQEKQDNSPLTEADQRAHNLIAARLSTLPSTMPILSEEDVEGFPGADSDGRYWLVDPLDGTKEFIKRNGEFTVNIALIQNGYPVAGIVHAPVLDVTYLAAAGVGAFKQEGANAPRQPIHVAASGSTQPLRVVGSRSHAGDSLTAFLTRLGAHTLVSMGSSLKFCLVAEGRADLYPRLGPTSLWDTAAAQCVVEQAGGSVTQLDGARLSYGNPAQVLNPHFIVSGATTVDWSSCLTDV